MFAWMFGWAAKLSPMPTMSAVSLDACGRGAAPCRTIVAPRSRRWPSPVPSSAIVGTRPRPPVITAMVMSRALRQLGLAQRHEDVQLRHRSDPRSVVSSSTMSFSSASARSPKST
jgi:hypothetical protein